MSKKNKYRERKTIKFEKRKLFQKTLPAKKRRKELRKKKASKGKSTERREGISYQSNMGLDDLNLDQNITLQSIESKISFNEIQNFKILYFDVETTGLRITDQIVQVFKFNYSMISLIFFYFLIISYKDFKLIFTIMIDCFKIGPHYVFNFQILYIFQ